MGRAASRDRQRRAGASDALTRRPQKARRRDSSIPTAYRPPTEAHAPTPRVGRVGTAAQEAMRLGARAFNQPLDHRGARRKIVGGAPMRPAGPSFNSRCQPIRTSNRFSDVGCYLDEARYRPNIISKGTTRKSKKHHPGCQAFEIARQAEIGRSRKKAPPMWRGLGRPIVRTDLREEHKKHAHDPARQAIGRKEARSSIKEGRNYTQG